MSDQAPTQVKEEQLPGSESATTGAGDEAPAKTAAEPAALTQPPTSSNPDDGLPAADKTVPQQQNTSDDKTEAAVKETQATNPAPASGEDAEVAMETSTIDDKVPEEKTHEQKAKEPDQQPEQNMEATPDQANTQQHQEQAPAASEPSQASVEPKKEPASEPTSNQAVEQQITPMAPTQTNENKQPEQQHQPPPAKQPPQQTLPTRDYLNATVVPILHSALSQLAKIRPDDPVAYLGNYLLENKNNFPSESK